MIFRRILRYVIIMAVVLVILSVISLFSNWAIISSYFVNSFNSIIATGLYFFIIGFGFWLLIRSVTR